MYKETLETKWRDDLPVYKFFTGAEAKKYHGYLRTELKAGEKSFNDFTAKLADLEKPGRQKGLHEFREIKKTRAGIGRGKQKMDAAKFRIDKIEAAIKDWFAE